MKPKKEIKALVVTDMGREGWRAGAGQKGGQSRCFIGWAMAGPDRSWSPRII